MSRKSTGSSRRLDKPRIDRFAEAAERAHVPVEEFRLWCLRHLRGVNPKQWSHWETGEKPIPERHIIDFLLWKGAQERLQRAEQAASDQ